MKDILYTHNLRREGECLIPEPPLPTPAVAIPAVATLVCNHTTTGAESNHLIYYREHHRLAYIDSFGREHAIPGEFPEDTVISHAVMGNIVALSHAEGMTYLLWQDGDYTLLGGELPFPLLDFHLERVSPLPHATGAHKSLKSTIRYFRQLFPTLTGGGSGTVTLRNREEYDAAVADATDHVYALLNTYVKEEVREKGRFHQPFLVRYALRMYDGSYVSHSAPILMQPAQGMPRIPFTLTPDGDTAVVTSDTSLLEYYRLDYRLSPQSLVRLLPWGKLLRSIDIFVSSEIPLYDTDGKIEYHDGNEWCLPANEHYRTGMRATSLFYRIASIEVEGAVADTAFSPVPLEDSDFNALTQRMTLPDDYRSRWQRAGATLYNYCGRLNAGGGRLIPPPPYPIATHAGHEDGDKTIVVTGAKVWLKIDGKVVAREVACEGEEWESAAVPEFIYYPDSHAFRIDYRLASGDTLTIPLAAHDTLYGAISADNSAPLLCSEPLSGSAYLSVASLVNTSAVGNPFLFPARGECQVGTSAVVAMCAAVAGISQGQFGEYPIYAFTEEGIWALSIGSDGWCSSARPISRERVRDRDAIAQVADGCIAMISRRGEVLLLAGGTCRSISRCFDEHQEIRGRYAVWREFLPSASISFDYENERLLLASPEYGYAWRYHFPTGMWGTVGGDTAVRAVSEPFRIESLPWRCEVRLRHVGHVSLTLFGSNDHRHWCVVSRCRGSRLSLLLGSPRREYFLCASAEESQAAEPQVKSQAA